MATTIKSPLEGYTGTDTYGPLVLSFKDGEAVTEEKLSDGHKAYFKANGYKVSTSRSTAEKTEDGPFDPAKHNQDDVFAYLTDADDEERARVLAAEAEGKGRKGIAEWTAPAPVQPEGGEGDPAGTEGGGEE
jgi:hypothetical protein